MKGNITNARECERIPISSSFSRSILDTLVLADRMSASLSFNSLNSAIASFLALWASFSSFCCVVIFSFASWRTLNKQEIGIIVVYKNAWICLRDATPILLWWLHTILLNLTQCFEWMLWTESNLEGLYWVIRDNLPWNANFKQVHVGLSVVVFS